jgi:uncharacterized membrane protein YecN with MAPEG domain
MGRIDMHIAAAPQVTLIFAAALGLLNLWLGVRLSRLRFAKKVSVGHGNLPVVESRMRAHANFNEYVPITLILMMLVEMQVGASRGLWLVGALLVLGRVLHPFGMDRPAPNPYRVGGMTLTWAALIALVVWAILLAYGVRLSI